MTSRTAVPQLDLRRWLFARSLRKFAPMADDALTSWKQSLFGSITGSVLEIGAGTGLNARYLKNCSKLIAVEPNPFLLHQLARVTPHVKQCFADRLDCSDESVDAVISTLVLCSVPDPSRTLTEIARVLKPGGTYSFIEHVAAPPGTRLRLFQRLLRPLCRCLGDGCQPDRNLVPYLLDCGFHLEHLEQFTADVGAPLIRNFIAGVLRKP
jgi:ubiquinone/menaquinone biosynthesis C-methylase UbiE